MDDNSEKLRAQAKEELRQGKIIDTSLYETDMKVLVEELSIYQIELEHQNQELMLSQNHLQQSNNRYLDLFDNAPVGYLIVDSTGIIKDINQTACVLLENSKTQFLDTKISKLIHPDYQDIYYLYFRTLIHQKLNQPCDIKLRKANNSFFYGRIQGVCQTSEIDSDPEFRLAISDISSQKEMEIKLLAAKAQTEKNEKASQNLLGDLKAEMKLRAKNELALRESETQYRNLANSGFTLIWTAGTDKLCNYFNEPWLKFTGRTLEQEMGNGWAEGVHPDDFDRCLATYLTAFDKHEAFEMEYRLRHVSGEYRWILDLGTPNYNSNNEFIGYIGNCFDINERKDIEIALLDAEWKFKALFELGPIGVAYHRMIYDEAGAPYDYYFIDANNSYNELTGINPKGMTVRQAFPGIENDPADWIGMFGRVAKTGETIRFEQFLESNQRWYDCVGYQYKPDHFVAAFNEITKRKEAEIALKESELRFKVLFDDAPDAMLLADPVTGEIVEVNTAACLLFKKEKSELVGLLQYELHPATNIEMSISSFKDHFEKTTEANENVLVENSIICSDGTEIPVEILGQSIQIGEKTLMFGIFRDISKRKKAEEKLIVSETKFRNFFENSVVGKSITSIDGKLTANKALCDILGYSEEELQNLNWKEITHPEDVEMNIGIVSSILKGEKDADHWEKRYIHKNGTIVWTEIATTLQRDNEGKSAYFITEIIDITERKKAEEDLQKSEERYRSLLLYLETGIVVHAADSSIVKNNPRASELLRLTTEQMLGKVAIDPDWKFLNVDNSTVLVENYPVQQIRNNKQTIKNQIFGIQHAAKSDIVWVNVNGFPVLNNAGEIIEIVISFNDITERKKAEQALKRQNELFNSLIRNLPMGVFMVDAPSGIPLLANEAALTLLGRGILSDANRHNLHDLYEAYKVGSEEKYPIDEMPIIRGMKGESSRIDDMLIIRPDGTETLLEIFGSPVKDEDGNIWSSLVSFIDITERKLVEAKLRQSEEKFRAVAELSPLAIYSSTGSTQKAVYINDAFYKIFGYTREDVPTVGEWWIKAFPDEMYRQQIVEQWTHNIEYAENNNTDVEALECVCTCKDGSEKNIVWVGKTIENEFWAFGYDLTEQKLAEKTLKNSQKLLSDTEKIGKVGGWEFNMDTFEQIWTEETYNIHEVPYSFDATIEKGINFYTPESLPIIQHAVKQAVEHGKPFDLELEIITAKGNRKYIHTIGQTDIVNRRVFGFFQDITERKKTEEQINMQMQELRRWYDVTLDREGRVLELKREVNELLKMHGEALRYGNNIEESIDINKKE